MLRPQLSLGCRAGRGCGGVRQSNPVAPFFGSRPIVWVERFSPCRHSSAGWNLHEASLLRLSHWIPAFAGMTVKAQSSILVIVLHVAAETTVKRIYADD